MTETALAFSEKRAVHLLEAGLSESTRKVFWAGWNHYMSVAKGLLPASHPITPEIAMQFVWPSLDQRVFACPGCTAA